MRVCVARPGQVMIGGARQRKDLLLESLCEGFMVGIAEPEHSVTLVDPSLPSEDGTPCVVLRTFT